jgi:hypothetical protein
MYARRGALPTVVLLAAAACASARGGAPRAREAERRIRADAAAADVAWLAAPEREGRGVGSAGGAAAAAWVAERMRALGLAPAGTDGYLQPLLAPVRATLAGENRLAVSASGRGAAGPALDAGDGWQPFTFSDSGAAEGELVWAGYGITAPALGWDDYAGLEVKGKIVVVAAHIPREDDPASPFRDPRHFQYGEWRYKAMNARDHGAAAVIGVRDAWHHDGADELPPWRGQVSSRAGIVAAQATLGALDRASPGLAAELRALAGATAEHRRPHSGPLARTARLAAGVEQEQARTANVVGLWPGRERRDECVVVGAHLDHLGHGGESSLAPAQQGAVHPGADDNASGVAALLAIADALVAAGPQPRSVLLVAFAAEELGLLGSSHLVREPPAACPVEKMQLMVNLDMVGRPRDGKLYLDGTGTAKGLRERVAAAARADPATPLEVSWGAGDGYGPSDHTSFHARGVPVLFFFTGAHGDYHRPTDTADKVDPQGLAEVARLAYRSAVDAARGPRLEVVRAVAPPPERGGDRGYGAYLGTIPDFTERREPGVLVSAVRPGSPAERAGLAAGDVLTALGATRLVSLKDLGYALRAHRPGDEVEVAYRRGEEERTAKLRLEERK